MVTLASANILSQWVITKSVTYGTISRLYKNLPTIQNSYRACNKFWLYSRQCYVSLLLVWLKMVMPSSKTAYPDENLCLSKSPPTRQLYKHTNVRPLFETEHVICCPTYITENHLDCFPIRMSRTTLETTG